MENLEKRKTAPIFKTIRRALSIFVEFGKTGLLVFRVGYALLSALTVVTSVFSKYFFNSAADILRGDKDAFQIALFWLGVWVVVELLIKVADFICARVNSKLYFHMQIGLQETVLKHVSRIKIHYFDNPEAQKKIRNVKDNFYYKVMNAIYAVIRILTVVVSAVTAIVVLVSENWLIALVVFVLTVPSILVSRMQTEREYNMSQWQSFDAQMMRYLGLVLTKRKYVKEMRFYQLYDYVGKKYDETAQSMHQEQMRLAKRFFSAGLGADLISYAAIASALILISIDIFSGKAGIGSFVLVYSTVGSLQSALNSLFIDLEMIGDNGRYLEDYEEVMSYEIEEDGADSADMDTKASLKVTFEHVYFSYPGSDREVLKDVNVTLNPGEKIAVVGENGSGKSTFVALLTGLYEPTKGRILVNGKPIRNVLGFLREHVSCTTQEFLHLEGTVEDNVKIGDYNQIHTTEDVREVLAQADLLEDIDVWEKKEQTPLGNLYEGSADLSGGQWQKLAMARNLIKQGASMMILDEPTAALDPLAESKLYHDFSELTKDKSVLLISHRLGATRLADRVLVFNDGHIVESGSHDELLHEGTLYHKMYQAQAQWYV